MLQMRARISKQIKFLMGIVLVSGSAGVAKPETPDFKRRAQHWAFQAVEAPIAGASIDQILNERLSQEGIIPLDRAASHVLLRRLSFDLTGLPPSLEELEAFAADDSSEAIAQVVDRYLESPHFGEKWARHWLDVVRYSETKGHVTDIERPFAWKYRDYVIDAFNDDLPFDRFIREHIAGDLLEPRPRCDQTNVAPTATGALFFHEMHFMAVDPVKQRWDEIDAQIDVVTKAFLGLTVSCARCHDHKTDPVTQRDYYALAGIFYSTEQGKARTGRRQVFPEGKPSDLAEAEQNYHAFLAKKIEDRRRAQTKKNNEYFPISEELGVQTPADAAKLVELMEAVASADPTWSNWVRSAHDVESSDVPLLARGDYKEKRDPVPRKFLEILAGNEDPPHHSEGESGRLYLAERIADPDNPLTARVWVNRLWHHLFGRGIHSTPNDFGASNDAPSHLQLLDYLATQLIGARWSTKAVIREIVLSDAYQRTSAGASDADPDNRWFGHQSRRRLDAEAIRDAILKTCGTLDPTVHGPSIQPWVPPYATANKAANVPKSGPIDGAGRRSIYIRVRRNFPDPFLRIFDFPDPGLSTGKRAVTNVPSQALAMMNSPFIHDQADKWGAGASDNGANSIAMFRTALGRHPSAQECEVLAKLGSLEDVAHVILNMAEFRYVD